MRSEPDVNSYDAYLLETILEREEKISAKRLAMLSKRDPSSIYKFMRGERTIPIDVWQAVYAETRDGRVLQLITGDVPVKPVILIADFGSDKTGVSPTRIPPIAQCMARTLSAIKSAAGSAEHMSRIVADGTFDRADLPEAAEYERDANAAIEALTLSLAAVSAHKQRIAQ